MIPGVQIMAPPPCGLGTPQALLWAQLSPCRLTGVHVSMGTVPTCPRARSLET